MKSNIKCPTASEEVGEHGEPWAIMTITNLIRHDLNPRKYRKYINNMINKKDIYIYIYIDKIKKNQISVCE